MNYTHMLLEVYCLAEDKADTPSCCKWGKAYIGIHCIAERCPHCGYCEAENELALTDSRGIVNKSSDCIAFGGDMDNSENEDERDRLLENWYDICRNKIDEAYSEYMKNNNAG